MSNKVFIFDDLGDDFASSLKILNRYLHLWDFQPVFESTVPKLEETPPTDNVIFYIVDAIFRDLKLKSCFNGIKYAEQLCYLWGVYKPIVIVSADNVWNRSCFQSDNLEGLSCLKNTFFLKVPFTLQELKQVVEAAYQKSMKDKKDDKEWLVESRRMATCLSFKPHSHGIQPDADDVLTPTEVDRFWNFWSGKEIAAEDEGDDEEKRDPFNVLVIEDNYQDIGPVLTERWKGQINFTPYPKKPPVQAKTLPKGTFSFDVKSSLDDKYDLILLDLILEEAGDTEERQGLARSQEIMKSLAYNCSEIPVFILTWESRLEKVREMLKNYNADDYIHKTNLKSIPQRIARYYEQELGPLVKYLRKEHRRNFVRNLRYWRLHKDFLWFGNKCYHMVDHCFNHTSNGWNNINQLLSPILDKNEINEIDLYCLCMAVWLHDIGHKGNRRYGEPHEIRNNHGTISGELILAEPEVYKIYEYEDELQKEFNSRYKGVVFGQQKMVIEAIREELALLNKIALMSKNHIAKEKLKTLKILEKIALICIFHKSNSPINNEDVKNIKSKGKRIPIDFYPKGDRELSPITLEDIIEDEDFLSVVALFRFVDGLDINKKRVGDSTEQASKKTVIQRDLGFELSKLKLEIEKINDLGLINPSKKNRFFDLFYRQVAEQMREDQRITEKLEDEQKRFLDGLERRLDRELESYYLRRDYALFLSVQDGHFVLHSSIDEVKILPVPQESDDDEAKIEIHYLSNRKEEYLTKFKCVKEAGEEEAKTISHHLIGTDEKNGWGDGYVLEELNTAKSLLDKWFDLQKICLWGKDNKNQLRLIEGCKKVKEDDKEHWERWKDWDKTWEQYRKDKACNE